MSESIRQEVKYNGGARNALELEGSSFEDIMVSEEKVDNTLCNHSGKTLVEDLHRVFVDEKVSGFD